MGILDIFDPNEIKPKHEADFEQQSNDKVVCYACRWKIFANEAQEYRGKGVWLCALCFAMDHFQIEALAAYNTPRK